MKARFVIILVLLNIAILAAGYFALTDHWAKQAAHDHATSQAEVAAWQEKALQMVADKPVSPSIVYKTNTFTWSQIESPDYRQYITNLRAIGCPELTVRDIIMTDVMRLYAQRRGLASHNGREFKFWETEDKRTLKQAQMEDRDKQLAQINKDLPAVLRELLGINYQRELAKYFTDTDEDNRRLGFLSDDKRDQLLSLRDKFEGERERVTYNLTNGAYSVADVEKLRDLDRQQEDALGSLLSPEEKAQYELSMSPTADHLRKSLVGFNPSEAEFRQLFQKQQAIDAEYAYLDMADPSVRAAKAAAEDAVMTQFKGQLTPDRATALDRSKDPDYQNLTVLTEQYDLPSETSQTIADMRQAAEDQKQQLLANTNIPLARIQQALKAIQDETEKAARQTLGDKAYSQYSLNANWLRDLGGN